MAGQCVELDEQALVEQGQDSSAGGQLALGVDFLDGGLTDRVLRPVGPLAQIYASLPAVAWMSATCSADGSTEGSVTLVMGVEAIGTHDL